MTATVDNETQTRPPAMMISFDELIAVAWRKWRLVLTCIVAFTAVAAAAAFLATPKYRAQIVVAPVKGDDIGGALSGALGQLGGLASLAGVGMPGGENKDENLAFLTSRLFLAQFIEEQNLLPVLFDKKWDAQRGKWSVENPEDVPTIADGVRYLDEHLWAVQEDRRTGIVTLSFVWKDRQQAARWANLLIEHANRDLRQRAIAEAEASKSYLNAELNKTDIVELRKSIYGLIENQIKTIMLASVRPEYAFKVIDPAVAPDASDMVWPKRLAMILLGGLFGGAFGLIVIGWQLRRERLRQWRNAAG